MNPRPSSSVIPTPPCSSDRSSAQTMGWLLLFGLLTALLPGSLHAAKMAKIQDESDLPTAAPDDQALVFFYRPQAIVSGSPIFTFVDEEMVGVTKGNTYAWAYVDPGEHVFWVKSLNTNALAMEVKAGEIYYLQISEAAGLLDKSRAKLKPAKSPAKAQKRIQRCAYVLPTEAGWAKGKELARELWPKARDKAAARN